MARKVNKLTPLKVSKLTKPGLYGDGLGLWLQITPGGVKSWLFRYMKAGKARGMGLGPVHTVTLAEARDKAREARVSLQAGVDPLDAKRAAKQAAGNDKTFRECAEAFIEANKAGWRSAKNEHDWLASLENHIYPIIGDMPARDVDLGAVLRVLEPIWKTRPVTASRVRQRLEKVLDWSTPRGYRSGENPARWRGHLDTQLPAITKVATVQHHPAVPYSDLPAFMTGLRKIDSTAARALEVIILTGCRLAEVTEATWAEFDLDNATWTIPAERMKAGREHRVPLSPRAVDILEKMPRLGECVFQGASRNKPVCRATVRAVLNKLDHGSFTIHGFRSTFRDWAAEQTNYPREVAEAALAHVVKDATERAYQRGDLFEKRRRLMDAWAKYAETPPKSGDVVQIRKAKSK